MNQTPTKRPPADGRHSNGNHNGNTRAKRRRVALDGSPNSNWAENKIEIAVSACTCGDCSTLLKEYAKASETLHEDLCSLTNAVLGFESSKAAEVLQSRETLLRGMLQWTIGGQKIRFCFGSGKVPVCQPVWQSLSHYPPCSLNAHVRKAAAGEALGSSRARGHQRAPTITSEAQAEIVNDVMVRADVGMDMDQPGKHLHINPESILHVVWPRHLCDNGRAAGYNKLVQAYHDTDELTATGLYFKLKEYEVRVLSYSGFCKARKQAYDGGLPNPMVGATPTAASGRQPATISLLEGVSTRKKTAFSSHDECKICRINRLGETNAPTIKIRRRWQLRMGVHNLKN
jgi:hypothetical protein